MIFNYSPAIGRIRQTSKRPQGGVPETNAVNLSMGEPDFGAPEAVTNAMQRALAEGYTHYGDLNGDPVLRESIAQQATLLRGEVVEASQVSIGHGATGVLSSLVLALVGPGDRVAIPEPTYSLYSDLVEMVGGEVVWVPLNEELHLDVDATVSAAEDAKLLILCNPGNPTGAVFGGDELAAIGERLKGFDTIVVCDEAYSAFTFDREFTSALAVSELSERVIVVNTLSKTFALTGFRLGWSIAPPALAGAISQIGRTVVGAPNSAVQKAAIAALEIGSPLYAVMQSEYTSRRELVVDLLKAIPGVTFDAPQGAFYAFFRHGIDMPSDGVRSALAQSGVILRSGSEYGPSGEGYLRLSFAASVDEIAEGIERMARGLDTLRTCS